MKYIRYYLITFINNLIYELLYVQDSFIQKNKRTGGHATRVLAPFFSRDYPYNTFARCTNLQAVAVQLHIHHLIIIFNTYHPQNQTLNKKDLDIILQQLSGSYIITGYFNVYSCL